MKQRRTFLFFSLVLFILLISGGTLINLYTDWLFFEEILHADVFTKILSTKLFLGLIFGVAALGFIMANIIMANRMEFPPIELFFDGQTQVSLNLAQLARWIKPITTALGIAVGFFAGTWGTSLWSQFLSFQHRMNVGMNDPIFTNDIGFFLFTLPWLESLKNFTGLIIVVSIFIVSFNYLMRGGISLQEKNFLIDKRVKVHISLLVALFITHMAFGFYLDQFHLLYSRHGVIFGAGYTDIHARLLLLRILTIFMLVSAVMFFIGVSRGSMKTAFAPLGVTALVYFIGLAAYPALLQNLKVTPNEIVLEQPYIEHHISFTRFGYDLERIEVKPFDVSYNLKSGDIQKNNATIKNIRLWDDTPLLRTYSQLQQIRTYYSFKDVDNDRYHIGGEYMQVMMSPRELSYDDLPSRSWINERLVFTHGFGIAMGPVSRISREGLPEFIIKDIPPVSSADLGITRPGIYFGELSSDYVVVNSKVPEFDYPTSEGNIYTSYEGKGGVALSSALRKVAFAIKFKTEKLLLSSDITSQSRILYFRNILERARKIAPFLLYDSDPYIVVGEDGSLVWIIDAYTVSNKVPYSSPMNRDINYIPVHGARVRDLVRDSVGIDDPDQTAVFSHNNVRV